MIKLVQEMAMVKSCFTPVSHHHTLMVGKEVCLNPTFSIVFDMLQIIRPIVYSLVT